MNRPRRKGRTRRFPVRAGQLAGSPIRLLLAGLVLASAAGAGAASAFSAGDLVGSSHPLTSAGNRSSADRVSLGPHGSMVVTPGHPGQGTAPSSGPAASPATGQVTAHDGKFWLGSTPILLHGIDAAPLNDQSDLQDSDYAQIQTWNMNFVRLRVQWRDLEQLPPTKSGSTWTHTYDVTNSNQLVTQVGYATAHGEYVMIENALMTFYPDWLWQAPYNSHNKNYTTLADFETDFWTDPLMQQFLTSELQYITGLLKSADGVVGYEVMDEPDPGNLALNSSTVAQLLDIQYALGQAVRAADPPRVVFFTTLQALGGGLPLADLTQWKQLGNVAFDLHGYYGGRWGVGLNADPADPDFGFVDGTLLDFTINSATPPYLGTTLGQLRIIQYFLSYLGQPGASGAMPLVIGEFDGSGDAEPNMMALMGSMTQAFNLSGISWAAWSYNGDHSVFKSDGSLEPWVSILSAAARYPG